MARTLGSKNKPKNTNNFKIINLNKHIENSPIINDITPYQWVSFGKDNMYPTHLLNLYHNSIIHSACVDFLTNAIIGDGVDYVAMSIDNENELVPNYLESWDELLYKVAKDLVLFGGYAIQVIKNRNDKTYSFFHTPFSTIRFGKKDANGEIKKAYLSKDWSNYVVNKPIEIDVLNYTDDINIGLGKPYLLVYTSYNMFDEYYPSPHYISAIDAIRTDVKMQQYDLNSVTNMFTPSGILTMNQVSDDNERQMILSNIEATFTGSENANNIIICFRNTNDDKPVEFTPITSNTDGVNLFSDTTDRTIDRILSAHRVSRGLIGLPIDDAGFSSEGAILQAQYNLTNKILVNGLRKKVTNHINTILKLNGIEQELVLKPLSFNIDVVTSDREVTVDETRNVNEIIDDENEDTNVLG